MIAGASGFLELTFIGQVIRSAGMRIETGILMIFLTGALLGTTQFARSEPSPTQENTPTSTPESSNPPSEGEVKLDTDADLKKAIDEIGKAIDTSKRDRDELLEQQQTLITAIDVARLQIAAVSGRQLSFEETKKYLAARMNTIAQTAKIAELTTEKTNSPEPKKLATLNKKLLDAKKKLTNLKKSEAVLKKSAETAADVADVAFLTAARGASALPTPSPQNATGKSP
jgi:hypothetical protein